MLKRFEVENFKGFKDRIVFDFSARDYSFNQELIGAGLVMHALIYGKNGIGKSSLGTFFVADEVSRPRGAPGVQAHVNIRTGIFF